jgi:anti-sigma regulatory factor (Ser/Thr protein kinase)
MPEPRKAALTCGDAGERSMLSEIACELATNAVAASQVVERALPIRLWLLSDKERILILVWDSNQRLPVSIELDAESEGGRGLLLVKANSKRWGSYPTPDMGGKVVWAECHN